MCLSSTWLRPQTKPKPQPLPKRSETRVTVSFCCQQDDRRDAVRSAKGLNGLDYVEVSDDQLTLTVFFLGKLPPELSDAKPNLKNYLELSGGQRVTDIHITQVKPVVDPDPEKDDQLVIELDKYGDFST